jgi:ribose 5-phosphate isomerase RpiB
MNRKVSTAEPSSNGAALRWPGRVVTAQALERQLNGHRRLVLEPGTVITPLAHDHLRSNGIVIEPHDGKQPDALSAWGYAQQYAHPLIQSAVQSLSREGIALQPLPVLRRENISTWAREVAACVAAGKCCGGVVFCGNPGLFCCVSNKVPGLRAVAVSTIVQTAMAMTSVGANLLAVEMPGRTFFEIKQILRLLCTGTKPCCPDAVACTLRELDGHAHR